MEKITLNEYLKQGSVVENLKNFVGVTPENTVGLMTPERLAAVAGGILYPGGFEVKAITNANANNITTSGIYYLEIGCEPAWSVLFVYRIDNSILQIAISDTIKTIKMRLSRGVDLSKSYWVTIR